mmetsp:Transcript_19279/g.48804  ORF Transcript_19279/g.48804 Transcript_19279/m.48804 type:complete len:292 (-) Transcript_19279:53-928(-)
MPLAPSDLGISHPAQDQCAPVAIGDLPHEDRELVLAEDDKLQLGSLASRLARDHRVAHRHAAANPQRGPERLRSARHRPASEAIALVAGLALAARALLPDAALRVLAASEEAAARGRALSAEHALRSVIVLQHLSGRRLCLRVVLRALGQRVLNGGLVGSAWSCELQSRIEPISLQLEALLDGVVALAGEGLQLIKLLGDHVDTAVALAVRQQALPTPGMLGMALAAQGQRGTNFTATMSRHRGVGRLVGSNASSVPHTEHPRIADRQPGRDHQTQQCLGRRGSPPHGVGP